MPGLSGRDVHLTDYLKVIYRRRWLASTAFLLVFVTGTINTFTATPVFESRTRLMIEADERNVVSFKQVVEENQTRSDYYQTQYSILQSRALARKTLDSLQMWEQFGAGARQDQPEPGRGVVAESAAWVAGLFGAGQTDAAAEPIAADETLAQSKAIDQFLSGLSVTPIRNSRLVDVKYRHTQPALAATLVNGLAKNYIEQNLEYKFLASKEASDWLGARLGEQRQQVEQAEAALQKYREQNQAISFDDTQNIVVQKLADLNAAVTRAKTERIQKESLYNQLRATQSNPAALDTFPAVLANSFIQQQKTELADLQRQYAQLSERLGDKHPDLIKLKSSVQVSQAKLNAEIQKVVQSVRSDYQAALAQENSLSAALNQQKNEALAMNRKAIDFGVLERDVQSSKQIYDTLMQRAKETGVAGELKTSNIRVLDPAEPPRAAISPQKRKDVMLAAFGGLALALGLVFGFEYMDSRIKSPDEISQHLGLPFLGLLPVTGSTDRQGAYPMFHKGVASGFGEAFRAVRTNVLFSTAQTGGRTLVITSTGPGEGKSMIATNLATSLAQTGQRVLLVDADMRKPKVHDVFEVSQEPGLSNLLVGGAKASESVRNTAVAGLWLLAAGRIPPNPAELLGSQRFRDFLLSLKDHFDWIIIDSPPVMAVTDAAVIAHLADGVLFVVGAEMTSRHTAMRAVEQLRQAGGTIVGAVLNRVDLKHNGYYYSHYYRREYADYYEKSAAAGPR